MHRGFAWISLKSKWFARIAKGARLPLYHNGKLLNENMDKALISQEDLEENIRTKTQKEGFGKVQTAYMERCGEISIIEQ